MTAYLVLDFAIRDLPGFLPYAQAIPALIARHHGRYIVKGEPPTLIEGDAAPERVVILEFPSRAAARAFLEDPDAKTLFAVRQATTNGRLLLLDGCA